MTTIRVSCPQCGAVDLSPEEIALTIVTREEERVGPESHYAFTCPSCAVRVAKPADERIAEILRSGGVEVDVVDAAVALHPESPPSGPPLGYDDLLDLHRLLATDDWFDRLLALTR